MQSVIVYRNPAEAAMWEWFMGNGGVLFPFMVGVVTFFVVFVILNLIIDNRIKGYFARQKYRPWTLTLAVVAAIGVIWRMI